MPRTNQPPKYRHRTIDGNSRAYLTLRCRATGRTKDFNLGPYDSPASRQLYHRLVAEWEANGRARIGSGTPQAERRQLRPRSEPTVAVILAEFIESDAWKQLGPREQSHYRPVIKLTARLYGESMISDFGPNSLRLLRNEMLRGEPAPPPGVEAGERKQRGPWGPRYTSSQIGRLRRIFKWAVSRELVSATHLAGLKTLEPLRLPPLQQRTITVERINAIRPYLSAQVWVMVELQRLTGMRPGEVMLMRPCDVDRSADVWEYRPATHKNTWRGKRRIIVLGPEAQAVLTPFLLRAADAYCFSPAEVVESLHQRRAEQRKTPAGRGNSPGTNRSANPKRKPRDRYDAGAYGHAVARACRAAGVKPWTPYQLRHTAATQITRAAGLEAASVILGHSSVLLTDAVYADRDLAKAKDVARRIG
ncbi:MAG: tyrosine-type recombinase/integrase [Candidatus Eisenbacteria bacterium]|nr:tyrosine-type recombinase/integrase [Candidatus Eisenbacteria bacterium]